jgi:hypothetical protein
MDIRLENLNDAMSGISTGMRSKNVRGVLPGNAMTGRTREVFQAYCGLVVANPDVA